MQLGKKRLLIGASAVTAVGAAATLVSGVTFGLFSDAHSQGPSTFTAGSVTLDHAATVTCTVGNVQPGDSTAGWKLVNTTAGYAFGDAGNGTTGSTCSLPYTYSGSSAALAVDVTLDQTQGTPQPSYGTTAHDGTTTVSSAAVTSSLFSTAGQYDGWTITDSAGAIPVGTTVTDGGSNSGTLSHNATVTGADDTFFLAPPKADLVDGTQHGLQLLLQDGSTSLLPNSYSYTADDATKTVTALPATGVNDVLISSGTASKTGTIKLDWMLPDAGAASNAYQQATSVVTITVHAVQTDNNPLDTHCTAVGVACTGSTWS